jgi:hypothetical protein
MRPLLFVLFVSFCGRLSAQKYETKSASGTTSAQVLFNTDSHLPTRVVSLDVTSDLSSSTLTFQSGIVSYTLSASATNTATNVIVTSYGTLASNDVVLIQTAAGSLTNATVYSVANLTNVTFTAQIGLILAANDQLFKLGNSRTLTIGATTVRLNGEAIFIADQDQPFVLKITGTSACSINNAVAFRGLR